MTSLKEGKTADLAEFVQLQRDLLEFVKGVAKLSRDGEGKREDGYWVMENDEAYDTVHGLITDARQMLGWEAGEGPLSDPDLYAHEDE